LLATIARALRESGGHEPVDGGKDHSAIMKTHWYFDEIRPRNHPEVSKSQAEWVAQNYEAEWVQENGRIRRWGYVEDLEHWVRVILLPDGETLFNAFIDAGFKTPDDQ
jgi:hypothetical protein